AERAAFLILCNRCGPAEHGFDASKEFANREGLGNVIVGAEFEADDLVYFLATRGKHDDGNSRALGLELLADFEAAHARHHYVENYEVWSLRDSAFQSCDSVGGRNDFVSL